MKKMITALFALSLVLLLLPLTASAESAEVASGTCGDNLTWVLTEDGTLTISGTGFMGVYDEDTTPWFDYRDNIKIVNIANGVASIGRSSFHSCVNLSNINIPNSVTFIGARAFWQCSSLTEISIPGSVDTIGVNAFFDCGSLVNLTFGRGVSTILDAAFNSCVSLKNVFIPDSVTTISEDAFTSCTSLIAFEVDPNNPNYSSDASGVLYNKSKTILIQAPCALAGSYSIPSSVTTISDNAFNNAYNLTSVTIPNSVVTIGSKAFWDCDNLITMIIPDSVTIIGHRAFFSCEGMTKLIIGSGVITIGDEAFSGAKKLNTVCYANTWAQWTKISIGSLNDELTNANIHFNENDDHICDTCGQVVGKCIDRNGDEICDKCKKVLPIPVPAKPYKIANVVSGVHVYWDALEGVSKYGLWRSENGVNGTYKWIANPTVPHFTDTKVESGKTYYYKVTTMKPETGKHSEKSEAIGVTYVSTPDITSRTNVAAGVKLGWEKVTGATGYAIYRKSYSGTDAWVRVGTISGNSTFTWTDTSVKNNNGTIYKYTIRALAGSNMKTLSGCRNAGRTMARLSSQVMTSAAKASSTSIKCQWTTSSRVTGYEVRFMVGNTVYKTFTVGNYKTGVKTFTGLKAGQTYTIQVRTYLKVDGVGSFYSDWSTAKTVKI